MTPLRRKLNWMAGLLFALAALWTLGPLLASPLRLGAFCAGLQPGSPLAAALAEAAARDFRSSPEQQGRVQVYDLAALGRWQCSLRLRDGRLQSAEFELAD